MKAFLSHSSQDKGVVAVVAKQLGSTQIEYDEYTFEYTLSADTIRRALARSTMFVLFLSANSLKSPFVAEELRTALEKRAGGMIESIMIFALDHTSYKELPEWLREINVVQYLSNPKTIARKIQASLLALQTKIDRDSEAYLGREEDEKLLRKVLAAPQGSAPIALHVVGHFGIGRRTFLRNTLTKLFPRDYSVFVEVSVQPFEGAEELYRRLYALHFVSSFDQMSADFDAFARMDEDSKVGTIANILAEMSENGEFIIIDDQNGVYTDDGAYQPLFARLIEKLSGAPKPMIGFAQTRMMPYLLREKQAHSFHHFLRALTDQDTKELLSFSLKAARVSFNSQQLEELSQNLDGHPFNVRFAVRAIQSYGLASFLADPKDLIEWKRGRAEDFLSLITFSPLECSLLAALIEYRILPLEMLAAVLGADIVEVAGALRRLEEHCCIERREEYFQVSAPIRDAIRRDKRFEKSNTWKQSIGTKICDHLATYKNDEHVSVALVESAVLAAVRGTAVPQAISLLILPSHLLTIARSFYDKRQLSDCVEFCKRAFQMRGRLTVDGQIEVLRLWGLSAIRARATTEYDEIVGKLRNLNSRAANRIAFFLEGFHSRLRNDWDGAEQKFLECWKLSKDNQSTNRELASLYCKQRRYSEAEAYARSAYKIAPTNPFIIDIMTETLLGKAQLGLAVDPDELNRLMTALKTYGDAPGSSFFLVRLAQAFARERKYSEALKAIGRAIDRTSNLLPPYFIRADVLLAMNDPNGAEKDLAKIEQLLEQAGGFSEGDEAQVHDLAVRIMIEKRQFKVAKNKIDTSAFLPKKVRRRLHSRLARAIGFSPESADRELQRWAASFT